MPPFGRVSFGDYECHQCGRSFWLPKDLVLHLQNDHRMGTAEYLEERG